MALKEIEFLNKNNKLIIAASMVVGILYPFFIDQTIPIINDSKYLSIGVLVLGLLLFWEMYGDKRQESQRQPPYQSVATPQHPQPLSHPPLQQFPQPIQNPQYYQELQSQFPEPKQLPPPVPVAVTTPEHPARPREIKQPPVLEEKRLSVSDIAYGRVPIPEKIPMPKDRQKEENSSFKKFGKFGYE